MRMRTGVLAHLWERERDKSGQIFHIFRVLLRFDNRSISPFMADVFPPVFQSTDRTQLHLGSSSPRTCGGLFSRSFPVSTVMSVYDQSESVATLVLCQLSPAVGTQVI